MPPSFRARPRAIAVGSGALAVATVLTTLAATADAGSRPPLSLVAATNDVITVSRYDDYLDLSNLGVYLTSGDKPVEIWAGRRSYSTPVTSTLRIGSGHRAKVTTLPAGLAQFDGLHDFLTIKLIDAKGKARVSVSSPYCNANWSGQPVALTPDAPEGRAYPNGGCAAHPFTLRSLYGFQPSRGIPVSIDPYGMGDNVPDLSEAGLPDGTYQVKVAFGAAWRKVLKTSAAQSTATVKIKIVTEHYDGEGEGGRSGQALPDGIRSLAEGPGPVVGGLRMPNGKGTVTVAKDGPLGVRIPTPYAGRIDGTLPKRGALDTVMGRTATGRPLADPSRSEALASAEGLNTKRSSAPAKKFRPDLRSLPAFGMTVITPQEGDDYAQPGYEAEPGHEYLAFSATVWNAGPGPLVVDGFRTPGAKVMQAYQSFYDLDGKRRSYAPTGSMEYDPRPGHEHWHFLDFATYRLRKPDGSLVRSQKEAFCLAPTDAVDPGVKGADWNPYSTGLSTACGFVSALGIRETLQTGWGDTYGQYLPGQAFDITDLPNGTYTIEVLANPDKHLIEGDTSNNLSKRTIVLGGKAGKRTVTAKPVGLIDAP